MLLLIWSVLNVSGPALSCNTKLTLQFQGVEYFSSLFFQEVQHLSALQTAVRFLPNVVLGIILNVCTGVYASKFRVDYLVCTCTLVSAVAPLLLALIDPKWSYWRSAFFAMLISPVAGDGTSSPFASTDK